MTADARYLCDSWASCSFGSWRPQCSGRSWPSLSLDQCTLSSSQNSIAVGAIYTLVEILWFAPLFSPWRPLAKEWQCASNTIEHQNTMAAEAATHLRSASRNSNLRPSSFIEDLMPRRALRIPGTCAFVSASASAAEVGERCMLQPPRVTLRYGTAVTLSGRYEELSDSVEKKSIYRRDRCSFCLRLWRLVCFRDNFPVQWIQTEQTFSSFRSWHRWVRRSNVI